MSKTFSIAITKARVMSINLTQERVGANIELLSGNEKSIAEIFFSSDSYNKDRKIPYEVWMKDMFNQIADAVSHSSELSLEHMCNMLGEATESEVVDE
jgi:hypothetical protein